MLIPLTSALLVFFSLAGGLVAEVFSSFFFTYVTRPYDIGDRVYVATPGQGPVLYSLIVKDIEVMRTHFLTANGEAMVVSNSSVKNMALRRDAQKGDDDEREEARRSDRVERPRDPEDEVLGESDVVVRPPAIRIVGLSVQLGARDCASAVGYRHAPRINLGRRLD